MAEYKFVARWSVPGDDERQCGIGLVGAEALPEGDVETAFDAFWESLRGLYVDDTILVGYTWFEGPDRSGPGISWGDAFRTTSRSLPGTGFVNFRQLPPQVALVVTWPMPINVKRHRGRIYLPAPSADTLTAEGRFANAGTVADAAKVFIEACLGDDWLPVVHLVNALPLSGETYLPITSVRVNNVFDTQRRRGYEQSTDTQTRAIVQP